MPTSPIFKAMLPLSGPVNHYMEELHLCTYSYHRGRKVKLVEFSTAFSQGCGTDSTIAPLPLHFAAHAALQQFPHEAVKILAIQDDFRFVSQLAQHVWQVPYLLPSNCLKSHCSTCLRVVVNLDKSSALILQAHTIANPRAAAAALAQFCNEIPELKDIKLSTEEKTVLGVPIGHLTYLDTFMQNLMIQLQKDFAENIEYPYAQEFYMMLYHCCNNKTMHLLRDIGQHILLYSQCLIFSSIKHLMSILKPNCILNPTGDDSSRWQPSWTGPHHATAQVSNPGLF